MMLVALLLAACASAPASETIPSTDTAAAVTSSDSGDPNEMICRREQVTGTNFRRRVCMTRAEREQQRAEVQEVILERRNSPDN